MRHQRGFSFIEMMVTVTIMAILLEVTWPSLHQLRQRQREAQLRHALFEVRDALDAHKRAVDEGRIAVPAGASGYPASLEVLVEGVVSSSDAGGARLYFLRRIPADPMADMLDDGAPASSSWGLRSYMSSAEAPRPGEDVFDIYSRAPGHGLNGVPYAQW